MALAVKNPPASAGDLRDAESTPELGRSPGGGHGNPFWPGESRGQRSLVGYSPWLDQTLLLLLSHFSHV